jgi:hypothetical protein
MKNSQINSRNQQINLGLARLGANYYDMRLPETHALADILHPDEKLTGIIYGKYIQSGADGSRGRGALIATDQRILLLDKKPLLKKCDEFMYSVVSGITLTWVAFGGTLLLHTRMGDIQLRTFNHNAANHFLQAVESVGFHQ